VAAPGRAEDVARAEAGAGDGDGAPVHAPKPERGDGLTEAHARRVAAHDEAGRARRRGARLDEEPGGARRVVHGRGVAVEAPALTLAERCERTAAAPRAEDLAARHRRQDAALLLVGAEARQRPGRGGVRGAD